MNSSADRLCRQTVSTFVLNRVAMTRRIRQSDPALRRPSHRQRSTEAQEYREIDDERILVYVHNTGRGKGSGMEIDQLMGTADGANVFVIREARW